MRIQLNSCQESLQECNGSKTNLKLHMPRRIWKRISQSIKFDVQVLHANLFDVKWYCIGLISIWCLPNILMDHFIDKETKACLRVPSMTLPCDSHTFTRQSTLISRDLWELIAIDLVHIILGHRLLTFFGIFQREGTALKITRYQHPSAHYFCHTNWTHAIRELQDDLLTGLNLFSCSWISIPVGWLHNESLALEYKPWMSFHRGRNSSRDFRCRCFKNLTVN